MESAIGLYTAHHVQGVNETPNTLFESPEATVTLQLKCFLYYK